MNTTKKERNRLRERQRVSPYRLLQLLEDIDELESKLRKCRKAIRKAYRADWMVSCDWTNPDNREDMWEEVRKLAGVRKLT